MSFIINPYRFAGGGGGGDPDFANVSLLLPLNGADGSTTFTDESNNGFTVTGFGNAQLDTAQSKWGGSSLLLDGSGDYLSVPNNSAFNFGTGNFTIEFWARFNSLSGFQSIFDYGFLSSGAILIQTGNGDGRFIFYASGSVLMQEPTSPGTGVWSFYQIVRSGTTLSMYRGGLLRNSVTNSTNFSASTALGIGARVDIGANNFNGWVQDIRITKGVARANAVPTAAFPTF